MVGKSDEGHAFLFEALLEDSACSVSGTALGRPHAQPGSNALFPIEHVNNTVVPVLLITDSFVSVL